MQSGADQDGIIMMTKDDFDSLVTQAAHYISTVSPDEKGKDGIVTRAEFTMEELLQFKDQMYEQFNLNNIDRVALVPSIIYDVLLCSEDDIIQFAQNFLAQVIKKQAFKIKIPTT